MTKPNDTDEISSQRHPAPTRPDDPNATLPPSLDPDATLAPAFQPCGEDVPQIVGDYQILNEIARGGMGVVFRARQISLNRIVALKMILSGSYSSPADIQRFRAEAEAAAQLNHPNIIPIFEVGEHQGRPYFSMKLVEGPSLAMLVKKTNAISTNAGHVHSSESATSPYHILNLVTRAVHFAHQRGILHRDLKPGNVLIDENGTPYVTDFGLAKRIEGESTLTQTGAILGTPSYMAPEQARGDKVLTTGVDIYALGAILYEALTGRPPFQDATPVQTVLQVLEIEPAAPRSLNPDVDRDLETIALKCLEKEPSKRYESAAALADEFDRWWMGEPIHARPVSRIERGWRWIKRNPAIAALLAGISSLMIGGTFGMTMMYLAADRARIAAKRQEEIAETRAAELAKQQLQVRRELHTSNLFRAQLLLERQDFVQAEPLLWQTHFTRPDDDDQRAYWQLWNLYRQRPRRLGVFLDQARPVMEFSLDGRWIASCKNDQVRILDARTGDIRIAFQSPFPVLSGLALSPDGDRLAATSRSSGCTMVWDLTPSPTLIATCPSLMTSRTDPSLEFGAAMAGISTELKNQIQSALSRGERAARFLDRNRLVICGSSGEYICLNLENPVAAAWRSVQVERQSMAGFLLRRPRELKTARLTDGNYRAIQSIGTHVELLEFDKQSVFCRRRLLDLRWRGEFESATSRAINAENKRDNLQWPREFYLDVRNIALTDDGRWLITQLGEKVLQVWNCDTGRLVAQRTDQAVHSLVTSFVSNTAVVVGRSNDAIHVWRLPSLEPVCQPCLVLSGTSSQNQSVQLIHEPPLASRAVTAEDQCLAYYELFPSEFTKRICSQNEYSFGTIHLAATGPAVGSSYDGIVVDDGKQQRVWKINDLIPTNRREIAVDGDCRTFVHVSSGVFGSHAEIIDQATLKKLASIRLADGRNKSYRDVTQPRLSADGRTMIFWSASRPIALDIATKRTWPLGADLETQFLPMNSLLSRDGQILVVATQDRAADPNLMSPGNLYPELMTTRLSTRLVMIRVPDGRVIRQLPVDSDHLLAMTSDNSKIACSSGQKLTLISIGRDSEITELESTTSIGLRGAFSPDGQWLATGNINGLLRIWDARRCEEVLTLQLNKKSIDQLVFTPDSKRIRFVHDGSALELDLTTFAPHVAGNCAWNLQHYVTQLANQGKGAEAESIIARMKSAHPDAARLAWETLAKLPLSSIKSQ